jgi:hypothetical protein
LEEPAAQILIAATSAAFDANRPVGRISPGAEARLLRSAICSNTALLPASRFVAFAARFVSSTGSFFALC